MWRAEGLAKQPNECDMGYELRAGESLGEGVRRVCCEQVKGAIEASRSAPKGDVSPVHGTRRHLKKARAALRLMSRHVRPEDFKREHRELRDVGRLISEVRDAEVRLGTVRHFRQQSRVENEPALKRTEDLLARELEGIFAASADWQTEAQTKLTGVRKRMAQWHLVHLDCKQIRRVVQATYKRGRAALELAQRIPTADNFHEFRKQVKELSFHLRILRPLHPKTFEPLYDELKLLAEQLGQANDLAFLNDRLRAMDHDGGLRKMSKYTAQLDSRREELQRNASELGRRFFAEQSKDLGRRIAAHFELWNHPQRRHDHRNPADAAVAPRAHLLGVKGERRRATEGL